MPVSAVLVMGVSGSGKTTLGRALAPALAAHTSRPWTFADADDFHSAHALQKMSRGVALTDADRAPWLAHLARLIEARIGDGPPLVLACSALKASYRKTLHADDARVFTVWLDAPATVLAARLNARLKKVRLPRGQSPVGPGLLPSQLATLDAPTEALRLDAVQPVETLVAETISRISGV